MHEAVIIRDVPDRGEAWRACGHVPRCGKQDEKWIAQWGTCVIAYSLDAGKSLTSNKDVHRHDTTFTTSVRLLSDNFRRFTLRGTRKHVHDFIAESLSSTSRILYPTCTSTCASKQAPPHRGHSFCAFKTLSAPPRRSVTYFLNSTIWSLKLRHNELLHLLVEAEPSRFAPNLSCASLRRREFCASEQNQANAGIFNGRRMSLTTRGWERSRQKVSFSPLSSSRDCQEFD